MAGDEGIFIYVYRIAITTIRWIGSTFAENMYKFKMIMNKRMVMRSADWNEGELQQYRKTVVQLVDEFTIIRLTIQNPNALYKQLFTF